MDRHTTLEGSASSGPVEESPSTLAKRPRKRATVPAARKRGNKGPPPRPEGEEVSGHDRTEGAEPSGVVVKIVRATARLELDRRQFGWDAKARKLTPEGRAAWKVLQNELYGTQRLVARAQNACIRQLWREDSERLDAYLTEHGENPPSAKLWACGSTKLGYPAEPNLYQIARAVAPQLTGATASVCAQNARQRWMSDRFEALIRQSKRPPHFRDTVPIPLRAAEFKLRQISEGEFLFNFSLLSGRGNRHNIAIKAHDAYQKDVLAKIASGEWKHGNVLLDRGKKKGVDRWYFRLAYKRCVTMKPQEGRIAAINRGIRAFLVCVTEDRERWMYDGDDIVAYLKQIQRRRKQYQYNSKASGRTGRGRKRILRPIEKLSGKGERWRQTKCQTIARQLTKWLVKQGISTLLVEDFQGIRDTDLESEYVRQLVQEWPYYQLEQRIRACCAEEGIHVETRPSFFISQECPGCGHVDEANADLRHWQHRCVKCSYREHLDASAARILLKREHEAPDDDAPPKSKRKRTKRRRKRKK